MAAKNTSAGMENIDEVNRSILASIAARLESSETLGATDVTGKASTSEKPSVPDFAVKSAVENPGGVDVNMVDVEVEDVVSEGDEILQETVAEGFAAVDIAEEDLSMAMVVYSPPRLVEEVLPEEDPIAKGVAAEDKNLSGTESATKGLDNEEAPQTTAAEVEDKGGLDHLARVLKELKEDIRLEDLEYQPSVETKAPKDNIEISSGEEESVNVKKRKKIATPATRTSKRTKKVVKVPESPKVQESLKVQVIQEQKPRTLVEEFSIDEEFMRINQLVDVFDLIQFQKWDKFLQGDDAVVDKEAVVEFYRQVKVDDIGSLAILTFHFRGKDYEVTSRDVAHLTGLDHEGFDVFAKKSWPKNISVEEKIEMEERVCGYADTKVIDLQTNDMDPKVKILHRLLIHCILPRGSKPALAQIMDILALDQVLRKQKVNWPKLFLYQMEYAAEKYQQVGHARVIKRILQFLKIYEPSTETQIMKPLTMLAIGRWSIVLDAEKGWIRKRGTPAHLSFKEFEEVGEASGGADMLTQLDQKVTDLAEDFTSFKGYVKREFADLKKIMKDLLAKVKKA